MTELPIELETELIECFHTMLREEDSDLEKKNGTHELPNFDVEITYRVSYCEYERNDELQHSIEVVFVLPDDRDLDKSEIDNIESDLSNILKSTLSFNKEVEFEPEGEENLVFGDEIIHSFGENIK